MPRTEIYMQDGARQALTQPFLVQADTDQLQGKYQAARQAASAAQKLAEGLQSELSSVMGQLKVRNVMVPQPILTGCMFNCNQCAAR